MATQPISLINVGQFEQKTKKALNRVPFLFDVWFSSRIFRWGVLRGQSCMLRLQLPKCIGCLGQRLLR